MNVTAHPTKAGFEVHRIVCNITEVMKGDEFGGRVVATVKRGTKWTELRTEDGTLIYRGQNHEELDNIRRTIKSKATLEAETRAFLNERIKNAVDTFVPRSPAILEKMQADVAKGYMIDSFSYEKLFTAQAEDRIMARFVHVVTENLGEVTDHQDILDAFRGELVKELSHKAKYITNRSTSACSNLIADHEVAAIAEFLDRAPWRF